MNTIDELHWIEKNSCIYNIHYCKAGIGIQFYEKERVGENANWRDGVTTYKYYETFELAIESEYKRLKHTKGEICIKSILCGECHKNSVEYAGALCDDCYPT